MLFLTFPVLVASLVFLGGGTKEVLISVVILSCLLFLPGFLLFRLVAKGKQEYLWAWLAALPMTLVVFVYPALGAYALSLRLDIVTIVVGVIVTLLALLNIYFKKEQVLNLPKKVSVSQLALLLLMVAYFVVALKRGSHEAGDAVFHISYIRHLMASTHVNPFEAHFPIDIINPSAGYSLWYFLMAIAGKLASVDAYVIWRTVIYLLAPLLPVAGYYFAKAIVRKDLAAIWAVIFSTYYSFHLGTLTDAVTVNYPDRIARILMIAVIVYMVRGLFEKKENLNLLSAPMVIISFLITASFSTHMFSWLTSFLFIFIFFLIDFFVYQKRSWEHHKKFLIIAVGSVFLSLPALCLKLSSVYNYGRMASSATLSKSADVISLGNGLIVTNPNYFIQELFIGSVALLFIIQLLNFGKKKEYWYYYAWFIVLVPAFVMLFPPLATVFALLFSQVYLLRLLLFMPLFLIMGVVLSKYLESRTIIAATLLALLLIVGLKTRGTNFRVEDVPKIDPAYSFIADNIPPGSVLASNLWDSYYIAAYSDNYIVSTFKSHMSSLVDRNGRIKDVGSVLSGRVSVKETEQVLQKYNVDYIVIRKKAPERKGPRRYWNTREALFSEESAVKYQGKSGYTLLYEDDFFLLFKVE